MISQGPTSTGREPVWPFLVCLAAVIVVTYLFAYYMGNTDGKNTAIARPTKLQMVFSEYNLLLSDRDRVCTITNHIKNKTAALDLYEAECYDLKQMLEK